MKITVKVYNKLNMNIRCLVIGSCFLSISHSQTRRTKSSYLSCRESYLEMTISWSFGPKLYYTVVYYKSSSIFILSLLQAFLCVKLSQEDQIKSIIFHQPPIKSTPYFRLDFFKPKYRIMAKSPVIYQEW